MATITNSYQQPYTKREKWAQNAIIAGCCAPVATIGYQIENYVSKKPIEKPKSFIDSVGSASKEIYLKRFEKIGLNKLSEKYAKLGNKTALAIDLACNFLLSLGVIAIIRYFKGD